MPLSMLGSPVETLPLLCVYMSWPSPSSGSELASLSGVPHKTAADGPSPG